MKVLKKDKKEGLNKLIGKRVTIFCLNYIYTGDLIGVNKTCIKLENPAIVYETGSLDSSDWSDAQNLPNKYWYVTTSCIESFGLLK
jgi:hypothetical protein